MIAMPLDAFNPKKAPGLNLTYTPRSIHANIEAFDAPKHANVSLP
jgi:hypothetical protein